MRGLRLVPRLVITPRRQVLQSIVALGLALLVGAICLLVAGLSPLDVYLHIAEAGLFSIDGLADTAVCATPILLCALGLLLPFRMRLWNIGGEGQLLLGAWAATGVALSLPSWPRSLLLLTMSLAAMAAGGLWGLIPGVLRVRLRTSEVLVSLMLNYVALAWLRFFVFGRWSENGFPLTPQLVKSAWLPRLLDWAERFPILTGLPSHVGVLWALLLAIGVGVWLRRSQTAFDLRVIGDSARAAQTAGIPVAARMILAMTVSGAFCGLAGMIEVAGVVHRLQDRFSPGYGYSAIIVVWLARLSPSGVVLVSILFGALLVGSKDVKPSGVAQLLQGLILLTVMASEIGLRYQLVRTLPKDKM